MTPRRPSPALASAAAVSLAVTNASYVPKARAGELSEKGRTCSASSM
jgi:hypothetical protein